MSRRLIVNADDLGYDPEIDRGIFEAHARGIATSATAMVDTPFTVAALTAAPATLGLGVHVVLAEDVGAERVAAEVARQVDRFRALSRRSPTHLDSHRHAHAREDRVEAFARAAASLGLPVRAIDDRMRARVRAAGARTTDAFLGDAGLRPCWTPARLADALLRLPEGTSELMAHPGWRPASVRTSFGVEREEELRALCGAGLRDVLGRAGVELVHWGAL